MEEKKKKETLKEIWKQDNGGKKFDGDQTEK